MLFAAIPLFPPLSAYIRSGYLYYGDGQIATKDSEGYYHLSKARSSSVAVLSLDISRAKLSTEGTSHDRKANGRVVRGEQQNPCRVLPVTRPQRKNYLGS